MLRPSASHRSDARRPHVLRLDALVEKHDLGSLAYYYEGADGNEYRDIVTSVIAGNTLLTGHHVPCPASARSRTSRP